MDATGGLRTSPQNGVANCGTKVLLMWGHGGGTLLPCAARTGRAPPLSDEGPMTDLPSSGLSPHPLWHGPEPDLSIVTADSKPTSAWSKNEMSHEPGQVGSQNPARMACDRVPK